ncbi:hypothetical protein ACD591_09980 [Rufibacter glacialis]|uniref:Uncharacterized protein n=1 Tax=Rufibacter glacialis TaxID=1259555 RepID=A0A5M8Q9Z8_9BACT|nr:hypothetical protein [Rufibacter glacialis]KAA6431901.1 hypothetical protein FOE74_17490 [Rufibacter glacialis]GGK80579.1 hypothetical protein GCM10011405_30430 [Rufibacter glacialis]
MQDGKLKPEELSDFADRLNADALGTKARFGIFGNGDNTESSHIEANPAGLRLFSAQLLEALRRFEEQRETTAVLDEEAWGEGSETVISHIELADTTLAGQGEDERPETVKEQALKVGCLLTLLFLLVALVTGIVTIFKGLF